MNDWFLVYDGFVPQQQGLRETLCTLGNGYFATRGAAPDALADGTHYPGSYLAGGYNRLTTEIAGHEIENEDLVNVPNWLPLVFRIGDGPWLRPGEVEYLDYRQELSLKEGILRRSLRVKDSEDRITRVDERRFVSMSNSHLAGIELRLTPENWAGKLTVRSALDGGVTNAGVPRYSALNSRHLETVETTETGDDTILLRSRMVQSRREIVEVARTRIFNGLGLLPARKTLERLPDFIGQDITLDAEEGRELRVEKIVSLYTGHDAAISEPGIAALQECRHAGSFEDLLQAHRSAWKHLWEECGIEIETTANSQVEMKLRLHIFHLLQTVSTHSVDLDVGVPPRGWHGEAYRGKIMWDELFIFPFLNLRKPVLTRALLRYRFRRLNEARRAAHEAGFRGAMFPWQSGSDGREECQRFHLNPMSGQWIPDNSHRQRHINAAITFNVWQYYQVTEDREFLYDFGAELMLEIARFWASIASYDAASGRYAIRGVMGPDEFHTAYPGKDPSEAGGLDNNAYTNVMVAWSLTRTLDALDLLPDTRRRELCDKLGLTAEELGHWDDLSRNLMVPFDGDGVICQFEGYDRLKEFDWEVYREKYGHIERLDRILDQEGADPNDYKVSKQADVLMLFFLFSAEELTEIFARLGYDFTPDMIINTIRYHMQRTSHGSTLSWVTHAWVLARADRSRSWELFNQALNSDIADLQGGTTAEGIHLGAMAGTIDLMQRCYLGIEPRTNVLTFNPRLPEELTGLKTTVRYRGQTLDLEATQEKLSITSRTVTAHPITIAYRGQTRDISPGQRFEFRLFPELPRDHQVKQRDRTELQRHCRPRRPADPPQEASTAQA
ncbi:glycoside hydrolase family 65 protein [Pelagibius sp.]|uniref:glycoside hydrolase family 65 protein n=1 Tax=Pelagibius sp. TaxID=1931238 RepID=UPI00261D3B95|nr:glycosyl hydrolase family 65 protein [Pelagibius sp.]